MQVKRARQYVVYGKFNKRDIFSLVVDLHYGGPLIVQEDGLFKIDFARIILLICLFLCCSPAGKYNAFDDTDAADHDSVLDCIRCYPGEVLT